MRFLAKTLLIVALAGVAVRRRANGAEVMVDDCSDLERAVEATLTEDTIANITNSLSFFSGADCGNGTFKTFEVKTNQLIILSLEANSAQFSDIRFVVTDGGRLIVTHDRVQFNFNTADENNLEVDGGFLHVDQDSTARFLGDLVVWNYEVTSVTEEGSDFSQDEWEGGCVWNNGYFRVGGYAEFHSCDNQGGGESPPGRGGAIFNAANGSILFEGGVLIEDTFITDNEGNSGAGIYNLGKVNIKGDSIFQQLFADTEEAAGGGIFNAEGAKVTFRNKAAVVFIENAAANGGAVFNQGEFRFTGPVFFTQCRGTAIVNSSPGTMKLSEGSSFWFNDEGEASVGVGAVTNRDGATLDIPDDITFISNTGSTCEDIYLEGSGTDGDNFTCFP